jgi:hypothetical protein
MKNFYSYLAIFASWVTARIYVYFYNWQYFYEDAKDDSAFVMWYMPVDLIRQNLIDSLIYLRGEPPLPQIILGLLMKLFGWPFSIPADSLLLSAITLLNAFFMRNILLRYQLNPTAATIVCVLWCIYPANLGVEVSAFPISFYEALPGFIFTMSLWLYLKCFDNEPLKNQSFKYTWLFGVSCALLSMSRSTLSWIFILPIMAVLIVPGDKKKIAAGFIAITIQLIWALKNYAVYGQFNLETASDVGQNIFSTILNTGNYDDFYSYTINKNPGDPFVTIGIPCLAAYNLPCLENLFPDSKKSDTALESKLSLDENLHGESYVFHDFSKKLKPLYADYLIHNPEVALKMIGKSYVLFWGNIYWQVSYIKGLDADPLILGLNACMEKYKILNILAIHSVGILAFIAIFISFARQKSISNLSAGFLYASLAFSYVAIISSLGDHGENARYRVDVESLVWLLPFMAYRCLQQIKAVPQRV